MRQARLWCHGNRVEPGRSSAQAVQPSRRRCGWKCTAPGKNRRQNSQNSGLSIVINTEQTWRRKVMLLGEGQRGFLCDDARVPTERAGLQDGTCRGPAAIEVQQPGLLGLLQLESVAPNNPHTTAKHTFRPAH